jgi:hypothetical protein
MSKWTCKFCGAINPNLSFECHNCDGPDRLSNFYLSDEDVQELIKEIEAGMPKSPPPLATMAVEKCVCPHCAFHNGRF